MKTRLAVLDFLRGIAICCVVLDHWFVWLGWDQTLPGLHRLLIFSVAPLFFLAGITFALSFCAREPRLKNIGDYFLYWWRKSYTLILTYLLASGLTVILTPGASKGLDFWRELATFPHQFYFIAIYLQLLLVAPLLLQLWSWLGQGKNATLKLVGASLLLWLLAWGLNQAPVFWSSQMYHPARRLLGGIELGVFGSGTLLGWLFTQARLPRTERHPVLFFGGGGVILLTLVVSGGLKNIFAHPPNFFTLVYGTGLLLFLTGLYQLTQRSVIRRLWRGLSFLGQRSLDIFIFSTLAISQLYVRVPQDWLYSQPVPCLLFLFPLTLMFCLVLGYICTGLWRWPRLLRGKKSS